MDLFFIIFIIFIIYVLIQIFYHYFDEYTKNHNAKNELKMESFKTTPNITSREQNQYYLEDASLEILLDDYDKLKETDIY